MSQKRIIEVTTVYGSQVELLRMTGSEELGRPFRFELDLRSKDVNIDLDKQLGQPVTVTFVTRDNHTRYFHGRVSQFSYAGWEGGTPQFRAVLRPDAWFLSHEAGNRIFQEQTVPDIVKSVLGDQGVTPKLKLSATYRNREYCVQYGETDFDFISRLLEEEGIYYYFEHRKNGHDMVLADDFSQHATAPLYTEVEFYAPGDERVGDDHVSSWELAHRVETQKFTVTSYNYLKSQSDLKGDKTISRQHGQSGLERYEYGVLYPEKSDGADIANVRIQEQQSGYRVASGSGNLRGVGAGNAFTLNSHPRKDQNAKHIVTAATYEIDNNLYETGAGGKDPDFEFSFDAMPATDQFRPARITPKAVVRGPQTAVVVGPSGDEIWTDKYGRVKVQFHWDREGKNDEKSSCWVRISQAVAGQKWGFIAIPRIGQEVIVDFLEGDPDQPIIVGSVYNDANLPPYDLPDNMTQTGVKTRSTKKGSAKNFNELRFEDKKDSEEVFLHAEKDFYRVVKNNDKLEVGLQTKDKGDQTIEIHNDRQATLNEGTDTLTIKEGDQKVDIKKGNQDIFAKKKINIEAGDQLTIKVGQSTLVMKKNGDITMNGMKLAINGKNSVKIDGKAKLQATSAQIKIAGTAKTDITGAMTKVAGTGMLDLKASGAAKLKGAITMIG